MADILIERRGAAGLVTLNRPAALNALTFGMIAQLRAALDAWAEDSEISAVIVRGEGPRAFCSGGDIRMFHQSAGDGGETVRDFWRAEYALNACIKHYSKPYVALMHGICMGGGLGISVHGGYRVAAEDMVCAMPETGIGFFPDVGASWFLPRCPGETGMYLALTGARARLEDALYLGLVTHVLPQNRWSDLIEAMAAGEPPGDLMNHARRNAEAPPLMEHRAAIDAAFSASTMGEILVRLDAAGTGWARETAQIIRSRSPLSLKVAFRAMREGRRLSFDDCMRMEYRIACRMAGKPDFREGIRAALIDKDGKPEWRPTALGGVSDGDAELCFAPCPDGELPV
jgi:enoyl-CoA hydratase